jgi:hypothetical protein
MPAFHPSFAYAFNSRQNTPKSDCNFWVYTFMAERIKCLVCRFPPLAEGRTGKESERSTVAPLPTVAPPWVLRFLAYRFGGLPPFCFVLPFRSVFPFCRFVLLLPFGIVFLRRYMPFLRPFIR